MKSICVSLETAKKLKEAGWNKQTVFIFSGSQEIQMVNKIGGALFHDDIYAPTAEEILRELKATSEALKKLWWLVGDYDEIGIIFRIQYEIYDEHKPCVFINKSLSEAAAQMWLWCKENGYIK